jgi:dsDNA-specific endonuclease/ATPase MutS2
MEYVMVPVPEEHVVDVMQHVARLVARASVVPWDDESVADFFDEVDEASRSVLALAARSISAGQDLAEDDAAKTLELNVREIKAIVRDLQDAATRDKREPLVALRDATVVLRNGRSVQKRLFVMSEPMARSIRAHERASLGDVPEEPEDRTE